MFLSHEKISIHVILFFLLLLCIICNLILLQRAVKVYHDHTKLKIFSRLVSVIKAEKIIKNFPIHKKQELLSALDSTHTTITFSKRPTYDLKLKHDQNRLLVNDTTYEENKTYDYKPITYEALETLIKHKSFFYNQIETSIYSESEQWINFKYYLPVKHYPIMLSILSLGLALTIEILALIWLATCLKFTIPLKKLKQNIENLKASNLKKLPASGSKTLKDAIAAINDLQTKISDINQEKDVIFACLSHDINTPLTRIKLRVAQNKKLSISDKEKFITHNINKIHAILNEMIRFSKCHHQQFKTHKIEIVSLLESIVSEAEESNLPIQLHSEARIMNVQGDADLLKRAFNHLIHNAIQYGNKAIILIKKNEQHALLTIEDEGEGLSDEEQKQAFDPFYRADKHKQILGQGLGLSIAKSIIEKHNGRIDLDCSKNNQGLFLKITLPISMVT